jgi:hypothetical protein
MRAYVDPMEATPDEAADDTLALFDLEETIACQQLKLPAWLTSGMANGRLVTRGARYAVLRHHRLHYRSPSSCKTRIVTTTTGRRVRLPYA